MERTRSEYLLDPLQLTAAAAPDASSSSIRPVRPDDRLAVATLLLDAYRGTVDDEGEGDDEALEAIDMYFGRILWPHSVVSDDGNGLEAMSFVVVVGGRHYIDPVATAASAKGAGRGRCVVTASLRSLSDAGVQSVGAVITDGNSPSERLFTRLGFVRTRRWG